MFKNLLGTEPSGIEVNFILLYKIILQSLIRIWTRLAVICWIRIPVETNADPKHWYVVCWQDTNKRTPLFIWIAKKDKQGDF